jgi:hypothetical protein
VSANVIVRSLLRGQLLDADPGECLRLPGVDPQHKTLAHRTSEIE